MLQFKTNNSSGLCFTDSIKILDLSVSVEVIAESEMWPVGEHLPALLILTQINLSPCG